MKVTIGPYPKSPKAKRKVSIKVDKFDTLTLTFNGSHVEAIMFAIQ